VISLVIFGTPSIDAPHGRSAKAKRGQACVRR
jgi:hypothetical protein